MTNRTLAKQTISFGVAAAVAAIALGGTAPDAQAAKGGFGYGCFKTNTALNIRAKPWASSDSVITAKSGEQLIKRKRFCNFRGYWCAVTTLKGVEGYADKSMLSPMDCNYK